MEDLWFVPSIPLSNSIQFLSFPLFILSSRHIFLCSTSSTLAPSTGGLLAAVLTLSTRGDHQKEQKNQRSAFMTYIVETALDVKHRLQKTLTTDNKLLRMSFHRFTSSASSSRSIPLRLSRQVNQLKTTSYNLKTTVHYPHQGRGDSTGKVGLAEPLNRKVPRFGDTSCPQGTSISFYERGSQLQSNSTTTTRT
jgi:hypothetical protein